MWNITLTHTFGHPRYGQLTAVKKGYLLTSITRLCHRVMCTTHIFKFSAEQLLVSNWSQAQAHFFQDEFNLVNITVFCLPTLELVPLFREMQEQSIYMLPTVHFFVWRQSLSLRVYFTLPLVSDFHFSVTKLTVGYPEQSLHHLVLCDKGFASNAFCRSASSFLICKTWKDQF